MDYSQQWSIAVVEHFRCIKVALVLGSHITTQDFTEHQLNTAIVRFFGGLHVSLIFLVVGYAVVLFCSAIFALVVMRITNLTRLIVNIPL